MKYALGYENSSSSKYFDDDICFINTAPIINSCSDISCIRSDLIKIAGNVKNDDYYISTIAPLNSELIKASAFDNLSSSKVVTLKKIIVETHQIFRENKNIEWVNENFKTADFNIKGLYIRYGNVELRAIEGLLYAPENIYTDISCLLNKSEDENFYYQKMNEDETKWISASDTMFNLKALITNAGFYLASNVEDSIKDISIWKKKYLESFTDDNVKLFPYPPCYPWFLNIWGYLYREARLSGKSYVPNYVNFPEPEYFFNSLKNKKVLIVTPFKEIIDRMINENRLKNLYKNFQISNIEFITISAPISTYPNRPDVSWSNSYNKLLDEVIKAIEINQGIDIFTASCGSYGIPLCSEIYQKFDTTSFYFGNYLHTILGVRQGCSLNFGSGIINDEMRIDSDLSKYKNMHLIDAGRYI
jgi:hypothetical protein